MDTATVTVGVAAIGVAMILREILPFLFNYTRGGGAGANKQKTTIHDMGREIRDLHRWHSPDASGRQTWKYDFTRIEERLEDQTQAIIEQTTCTKQLLEEIRLKWKHGG